jgi:hypothetical protein
MAPDDQIQANSGREREHPAPWEKVLSFAVAIPTFLLVVWLVIRNEPFADPNLVVLLRIILSVTVGVLGATIPGFLKFNWSGTGLAVRAGGAVGLVILSYLCSPAVVQSPAETHTERFIVTITTVPPSGGGQDSMEKIAGMVKGKENPQQYRVVVYAFSDSVWYVQPQSDQAFTVIQSDGTWSTDTHPGSEYASLLVRPTFRPPAQSGALPGGADVIAMARTKGR